MSGAQDVPPGFAFNPSAWPRRLPVLLLALTGFCIATYLALYQINLIPIVWEPFFGDGSRRILKESAIARLFPDAALGAIAYLAEAILDCVGGADRWRKHPRVVVLFGITVAGLGLTGVGLALSQPLVFGAFCTLCLASACCSILAVWPASHEVLASIRHLRGRGT